MVKVKADNFDVVESKGCEGEFFTTGSLRRLLEHASPGSTIRLPPGEFTGAQVVFSKPLVIRGAGQSKTVLATQVVVTIPDTQDSVPGEFVVRDVLVKSHVVISE